MTLVTPLLSHISEETAYLVNDYPYGFRLRCQIRYWMEYDKKRGFRFCSQTTNPKREGTHWNKPKKSTYCYVAAGMYLNEEGHVDWAGLSEYGDSKDAKNFLEKFGACLGEDATRRITEWIKKKEIFEAKLASGEIYFTINGERV